jgi:hypothetical protein
LITAVPDTGKSLSEALILRSPNPQYDKRFFIDLPVQYMKTAYQLTILKALVWSSVRRARFKEEVGLF